MFFLAVECCHPPISMVSSPTATGVATAGRSGEIVPDVEHAAAGTGGGSAPPAFDTLYYVDAALRILLLATSLTALFVLVTSTQTKEVPVFSTAFSSSPYLAIRTVEFQQSPALRYLLAALAITCFHSVFTLLSVHATRNSTPSRGLRFHLVLFDALMAGVLAAATGAGGAVAYLGLKGDYHAGWNKICNIYDMFCRHIAGAVAISLLGSIALVALAALSAYSLYRCSH